MLFECLILCLMEVVVCFIFFVFVDVLSLLRMFCLFFNSIVFSFLYVVVFLKYIVEDFKILR